jgi:hypothetical protein
MNRSCDQYLEDLVAYADGDLRAARRELVEAHLHGCESCRRRLESFGAIDRLLRDETPLRDDTRNRAEIIARAEMLSRPRPRLAWRQFRTALLAIATALAMLVVDHVRQPSVLAWENALPTVAESRSACWPPSGGACRDGGASLDGLPRLRVSSGQLVELLVARFVPLPPSAIAVTIQPLDGDQHEALTFTDDGYMIITTAPTQPGAYLMHVTAQWDGVGLVESALRLDVRSP